MAQSTNAESPSLVLRRAAASDLSRRLATAAIAGPLAAACFIAGGVWLSILALVGASLSVWELAALQRVAKPAPFVVVALLAAWAFPIAAATKVPSAGWLLVTVATLGGLGWVALTQRGEVDGAPGETAAERPLHLPLAGWALAVAGGLYLGTLLASAIWLRDRPDGVVWTTLVVAGTWGCDTAAFLVGKQWGRHKLATTVSPNKSIEGLLAGAGAALVVVIVGALWWEASIPRVVGLGLVVAVGALAGDLLESALKRQLGVKDSGWILPGHGGIMDRIDSLLLAIFLGYLYVVATEGWFWA